MTDRQMAWFLLQQDAGFLLALRKPEAIPFAGQWTLPGDVVRQHESASYAIARFGRDELDIDVLGDELVDTLTLVEGGDNYAAGIYRIGFEGKPRFRGGGPYQQVGWAYPNDLPEPMPPALRLMLQNMKSPGA